MKVTVTANLNVRVGKPSLNAPCYQYLAPGSILEVEGNLYSGDMYDGISTWYKDLAGNYYWSGGVGKVKVENLILEDNAKNANFWVEKFGLDKLFLLLFKEIQNIRITILDTGIEPEHPDMKGIDRNISNIVWPGKPINDEDGHGTHCAGIISASGVKLIKGVLPGHQLNIGKIMASPDPDFGGLTNEILINALDIYGPISDVISISAGFSTYNKDLYDKIKFYADQGVIIVAAIGNNEGETSHPCYPAKFDECISVGALNSLCELSDLTIRVDKIDICFPGENIISTVPISMGSYDKKSGTSMSTPFVAGIIALIKAKYPSWGYREIREKLRDISDLKTVQNFNYRAIKNKNIEI